MKVLLINGSPRKEGNTFRALSEIAGTLNEQHIETELLSIGSRPVQGCIACFKCVESGECVFKDELYLSVSRKAGEADGIIVGSPVYFAGPNGSLCALLDRLFMSRGRFLRYKPAAAVAVCRRGGASATFDRLNKYFSKTDMPIVTSQYWNSVHGFYPGEAFRDDEGLQTMRSLGRNMAWMLRAVERENQRPEQEPPLQTNFIR